MPLSPILRWRFWQSQLVPPGPGEGKNPFAHNALLIHRFLHFLKQVCKIPSIPPQIPGAHFDRIPHTTILVSIHILTKNALPCPPPQGGDVCWMRTDSPYSPGGPAPQRRQPGDRQDFEPQITSLEPVQTGFSTAVRNTLIQVAYRELFTGFPWVRIQAPTRKLPAKTQDVVPFWLLTTTASGLHYFVNTERKLQTSPRGRRSGCVARTQSP